MSSTVANAETVMTINCIVLGLFEALVAFWLGVAAERWLNTHYPDGP